MFPVENLTSSLNSICVSLIYLNLQINFSFVDGRHSVIMRRKRGPRTSSGESVNVSNWYVITQITQVATSCSGSVKLVFGIGRCLAVTSFSLALTSLNNWLCIFAPLNSHACLLLNIMRCVNVVSYSFTEHRVCTLIQKQISTTFPGLIYFSRPLKFTLTPTLPRSKS